MTIPFNRKSRSGHRPKSHSETYRKSIGNGLETFRPQNPPREAAGNGSVTVVGHEMETVVGNEIETVDLQIGNVSETFVGNGRETMARKRNGNALIVSSED